MLRAGWARNCNFCRRCDDLDRRFVGWFWLTVFLIAVLVLLLVLLVATVAVTTATAAVAATTATAAVTFAGALAVAAAAVKKFRVVQGRVAVGIGGFLRLLPPQTLGRLPAVYVLEELVYVDCLLDRLGWPFTNGGCCAN